MVRMAMPGLAVDDEDDKAYAIASKARALRLANPALNSHEAMQQAMQGLSPESGVTYQDGSSKLSPLPLPPDGMFEVGKYYQGPGGVGRFNGAGFDIPEEE